MTQQPGRRAVLAVALGATAAGCSKYGESSSTPSQTAPANAVLGKTAEIPVGEGKIFDQNQVVVTQPVKGTFKAFSSTCTHQGCQVTTVANGTIDCPCHGSKYSVKDGSVVAGPAPRPLPPKQITISGDSITLV
ncbi:Rieske (2Fe-2S) protein [Kribbella sp. NBC_00662]|jgi:nitrite reductase/ring-hydroxylating ferredoxin subunit|uniref:Rieske (2Fe-2S) protein n=1 Tax=Kribbella sp. NBC_00662 TaxID=2975969 RepID=UPI003254517C